MTAPASAQKEIVQKNNAQQAGIQQGDAHQYPGLIIRHLGCCDYLSTWEAMRTFTARRNAHSLDEIWLLQHRAVFTQGQAGRPEHLLDLGETPLVQSDRGGQVTWHGPGQLVAYVLIDLRRAGLGVKALVQLLEEVVIRLLAGYGLDAERKPGAPGVYVAGAKIAALGLRVRQGCSYHGLSLNHSPDLRAFDRIHPCGYPGLAVTSLEHLGWPLNLADTERLLAERLAHSQFTTPPKKPSV